MSKVVIVGKFVEPIEEREVTVVASGTEESESDADLLRADLVTQVERALATLSDKQREVLVLRFGLGDGEHTLEEIGERFAVTRERIRQIEAKALRKLRHPSRSKRLKDFLE